MRQKAITKPYAWQATKAWTLSSLVNSKKNHISGTKPHTKIRFILI